MHKNAIIAILILIILVGVSLFSFRSSTTAAYLSIGLVVSSFLGLLFFTRKKRAGCQ
ncbi:MAG TPA: hypothetical protein VK448_02770 [Dissulfurispiraceae bacterium]|nr:hypothetical protein [Dissulfurispiraceae bacterium]